jgi:hypothetical protein
MTEMRRALRAGVRRRPRTGDGERLSGSSKCAESIQLSTVRLAGAPRARETSGELQLSYRPASDA